MESNIVLAGFGGQGVLLAGQLLAEVGMNKDKEVSWMPSYGPEMRGGSANCSVIISDERIGNPIVDHPDILIAMNIPSLELFEGKVKEGGVIIYNSSLIAHPPTRKDVKIIALDCNEIAASVNSPKAVNMPIIGSVMALTNFFNDNDIKEVMVEKFGEKKMHLIDSNIKAIDLGYQSTKEQL